MIITDITPSFSSSRIVGIADSDGQPSRSSGLHLSQIYGDIERTLDPSLSQMSEQELAWYRSGGFLWERIFSLVLADSFRRGDIIRPGEVYKDGIIGSPDNIDLTTMRVVETKATWKSIRKFDSLERWFWVWLVQMKGYCHIVGALEAELFALFMNGDYRGSGPLPRAALFQFAPIELEENWAMLKSHAKKRGWM